jgi:hypothetical protein
LFDKTKMSQVICLISNVAETNVRPDFLQYVRLPCRRRPEVVANDSISQKGCLQAREISEALPKLEVRPISKVLVLEPPHDTLQTSRSSAPFFSVIDYIRRRSIKNVEQARSLFNFPVLQSLPLDGGSMLVCGTAEDIWGDWESSEPTSRSLLHAINPLRYQFPREMFFPRPGITMYQFNVESGEIKVFQRRGTEYLLSAIQPLAV